MSSLFENLVLIEIRSRSRKAGEDGYESGVVEKPNKFHPAEIGTEG